MGARGNAPIIPFFVRRERPGHFRILYGAPISAGNGSPAALLAATQEIATAMEKLILTEPLQWNCFKPMWPNATKQQELAESAALMAKETTRRGGESAS